MKILSDKIKIWAQEIFGWKNVEVDDRPDIDRIHLILRVRNIRMSEHEKFTRWFYDEYGILIKSPIISGSGGLTSRTKFLVQFMLPRTIGKEVRLI